MATVSGHPPLTSKFWTYEDYCRLDDDQRYEILDGELTPMTLPGPTFEHQDGSFQLAKILDKFVETRELGQVCMAPLDVKLAPNNVVQPDVLFVSRARMSILQSAGIFGARIWWWRSCPNIQAHGTAKKKRELYAPLWRDGILAGGPRERSLLVLALEGRSYLEHSFAKGKGHVTSRVLEGLSVNVTDVFRR